ncbi:MAG TPA: cytochrome b/b6 domain-containing protein [Polyangia bacterium]|jgi:formate dehydrogenase gamma subunit
MANTRDSFVRFSNRQRLEHLVMMIAFTTLTLTGLPQKYPDAGWANWIVSHLGGIDMTRAVHRAFGLVLAFIALQHIGIMVGALVLGRARATMLITRQDFRDAVDNLKYCLGLLPKPPKFDRFDYKQKWEYWGLLFGGVVMVMTGFVLWYPTLATKLLPGVVIPTAKVLHTNEAMLALLAVVVWHIYGAHLSPEVFPADTSIFTGRISAERMKHEHTLEYQRVAGAEAADEDQDEAGGAAEGAKPAPAKEKDEAPIAS